MLVKYEEVYHLSSNPNKSHGHNLFSIGGKSPHVMVYQAAIVSIIIVEVCRRGRN